MVKEVKFVLIMVNESSGCDYATSLVNWEESARVEGSGARTPGPDPGWHAGRLSAKTTPFGYTIKQKFFYFFSFCLAPSLSLPPVLSPSL